MDTAEQALFDRTSVRIEINGKRAKDNKIFINDQQIFNVQSFTLKASATDSPELTLTFLGRVELSGDVKVLAEQKTVFYRCVRPHTDDNAKPVELAEIVRPDPVDDLDPIPGHADYEATH
jgi:hypothetical protein